MADGKIKGYYHSETGEVVRTNCRLKAYLYYKRDGKKCGYTTKWKQVVRFF